MEHNIPELVAQLTLEEKAGLCSGADFWHTKTVERLGIPTLMVSDGPHGLRTQDPEQDDPNHSRKAVCFPAGCSVAASFDPDLARREGAAIGREARAFGVGVVLGPAVNIKRSPLCGRNFEYFSEDPILAGRMAAAYVRGMQSKPGVGATIKHFCCNNQEDNRFGVNENVSERALREIYLRGFEIAVKEGNANSIMTSYNPVNGHWTASNYDLNTTILRGEWGYQGIVMTDWWAKMNDVVNGGEADRRYTSFMVRAQNDLYMVVNNNGAAINAAGDDTVEALEAGKLTVGELQRCAKNICRFLLGTPVMKRPLKDFDPLLTVTAKEAVNTDEKQVCALQSGNRIEAGKFENTVLYVEKESILNVNAHFCFPVEGLAQGAANLYLNGELMATVQTGGTGERFLTQRMCRVKFMPGYYELKAEYVTPELKLDWIELE